VPDAAARFDQHPLPVRIDYEAIETRFNAIEFVARFGFRPERFGDDAKHSSAVPPVSADAYGRNPHAGQIEMFQGAA
jgi:hypothetical protein